MSSMSLDRLSGRAIPLFSLSFLLMAVGSAQCAEPWPSTGPGIEPAYKSIHSALDADTVVDFVDTPLDEVVDFLEDQRDIPIELDTVALDDVGLSTDVAVSASIRGVSLGSTLKILLAKLELTYVIENEVLMITTQEKAALRPEVRVYNVAALLGDDMDIHGLAMTLHQVLHPDAGSPGSMSMYGAEGYGGEGGYGAGGYDDGGGYGMGYGGGEAMPNASSVGTTPAPRIIPYKQLLIVRHTTTGQDEVARLLGAMAAAMDQKDQ